MNLGLALRVAWKALARNRMRSLLTMLGVIIGVAAVIAMLAIGNGARQRVQSSIDSMGTNTILIFPGSSRRHGARGGRGTGRQFTVEDWEAISSLPSVVAVSPEVRLGAQVVYGSANWGTSVRGTATDYFYVRNWELEAGRFFTDAEVQAGAAVAVLGKVAAEKLFGAGDPLGATVRIRNVPFLVIGVLAEKGESGWGGSRDDTIIVPFTTAQRRLTGNDYINAMVASARRREWVEATQEEILTLLRERHRVPEEEEDAFYVYNQAEISRAAGESMQVFTVLLGSIASVSLLVGGIGIMNIMLVSVTERIREIGIRMAVGARGADILLQFLIEAVVLSVVGGVLGILTGVLLAHGIASYGALPALVSRWSILLAFGFSVAVGVFFGFYPALQASRLDPIQALRHE